MLFALAFVLSYYIMRSIFRKERKPIVQLDQLTIYMIVGTIMGARIGHVLFYEPDIFLNNPLELFAIWKGGLASHGGALGIILGLYLFHLRHRSYSMIWLLDRLAIVAAISGMCIRIGNLFNSEILGRPTDVPWAFVFEFEDMQPRHPAQLYEAVLCLSLFVLTWMMYKRGVAFKHPGRIIGTFLILLFVGRFLVEFIKERQVGFENSLPLDMGQLLSLPFIAVGVWLLLRPWTPGPVSREPRTP